MVAISAAKVSSREWRPRRCMVRQWVDDDIPIELIWNYGRPHSGLIIRNETLADDEITKVAGIPVTTRVRTAFDLGRYLPRDEAIARLDSLMRSQIFSIEDVTAARQAIPRRTWAEDAASLPFRLSTAVPRHRGRPGFGCCYRRGISKAHNPNPDRRGPWPTRSDGGHGVGGLHGGPSTTAIFTAPTAGSTPTTSDLCARPESSAGSWIR